MNCARVSSQHNQNPEQTWNSEKDLARLFLLDITITQTQKVQSNWTTRMLRKDPAEQSQQKAQKKDNRKTQTQTQNLLPLFYETPETLLNKTHSKLLPFPQLHWSLQWLNPNNRKMWQMKIQRNLGLNRLTPFTGDRQKVNTFLQECNLYLLALMAGN